MFEGFSILSIIVVLSTANGASISQSGPSTAANQQNLMGANTVVSSKLWNDLSTRLHLGWEQFKWAAGAVTNKTIQAIDDLVSSNTPQSDPPPEFFLITEKTQNNPVTPPTIQVYQEKDLGFTKKVIEETNSTTTVISEERRDECDNETSCITWKVLKIVGSAIGIGFLIGLISPVLFYFTIITIGCCCYGRLSNQVFPQFLMLENNDFF